MGQIDPSPPLCFGGKSGFASWSGLLVAGGVIWIVVFVWRYKGRVLSVGRGGGGFDDGGGRDVAGYKLEG